MRTRVIAYVRVSTDKQADQGFSLPAQRAKVAAYAALYELDVIDILEETGSAKTLARPGLDRARAMLKSKQADALLVVKLDRLTRSVSDLGTLIENDFAQGKAALLSVSEQIDTRTAGGRLVLNILGSVSQWEREAIGERTSVAMRHMKAQGEYTGGQARYGFAPDANGTLQPVPHEQETLTLIRTLRAQRLSLRKIANVLTERGHTSRGAKPFAATQIARMVAA